MNDIPYFPLELLIDEYMHLDPAFKEKVQNYKDKEKKEKKKSGEEEEGPEGSEIDLGF
jgi:hypothetical protein